MVDSPYARLSKAELVELLERTDEACEMFAHELRGALSIVALASEALLRASPPEERRKGYRHLEAIRRSAARMSAAVSQMTDAMVSEPDVAIRADVSAQEVLRAVVEQVAVFAQERKVRVRVDCADFLRCACDRDRLVGVLAGVIRDAVKSCAAGSTIAVAADPNRFDVSFSVADDVATPRARGRAGSFELFAARTVIERQGGSFSITRRDNEVRIAVSLSGKS